MSIFSRIFKIGQAKVNKVVDGLEKPELMLEQAIRDKGEQIRDAKRALQSVIATERQSKSLLNKSREEAAMWEKKAERAMAAGKEDLAIKALSRAEQASSQASSMEPNWKGQKASIDKLKADIQKMEDGLSEIKRNKDFIIAQSKTAEVKKQIHEARAKASKNSGVDDLMARMKAKAERSTFEAEAAEELADTFDGSDSLDKEFDELGQTSASVSVQEKLAAMKSRLGKA